MPARKTAAAAKPSDTDSSLMPAPKRRGRPGKGGKPDDAASVQSHSTAQSDSLLVKDHVKETTSSTTTPSAAPVVAPPEKKIKKKGSSGKKKSRNRVYRFTSSLKKLWDDDSLNYLHHEGNVRKRKEFVRACDQILQTAVQMIAHKARALCGDKRLTVTRRDVETAVVTYWPELAPELVGRICANKFIVSKFKESQEKRTAAAARRLEKKQQEGGGSKKQVVTMNVSSKKSSSKKSKKAK